MYMYIYMNDIYNYDTGVTVYIYLVVNKFECRLHVLIYSITFRWVKSLFVMWFHKGLQHTADRYLKILIEPFYNIPKFVIDKSGHITIVMTPGAYNNISILSGSRTEKVKFTICCFYYLTVTMLLYCYDSKVLRLKP